MNLPLLEPSSIESQIISVLRTGPLATTSLVEKIQTKRPNTPKQSVYLALRKLKGKEVVAISGKVVSLHQVWLSQMRRFFREKEDTVGLQEASLLGLEEKEQITYTFNSLLSLDMFWAHAFMVFMDNAKFGDSVLLYNPHEWFLIARTKSEVGLRDEAGKKGVRWSQLIAGKTSLDVETKRSFSGKNAEYHLLGKEIFPSNYYVNCFGNFLIEVWLDSKAAEEIEGIYNSHHTINTEVTTLFRRIIDKKGWKHKMKISRNQAKSSKVRSLFKKYF